MLAGMIARPRATSSRTNSAGSPSRMRDEFHLGRDLAAPRVMQLRHRLAGLRSRTARATHGSRSFGSPFFDVDPLRAAGVVDAERWLAAAERDLAHRHPHALAGRRRTPCANWDRRWRTLTSSVSWAGRGGGNRTPFAGFNRIRFQGFALNPVGGIPLAAFAL